MNNKIYVTIYTLGISLFSAILYGLKTTQGFLTGTIYPLSYDIGVIFGSMTLLLGIALLLTAVRYFYLLFRRKPRNFLLNWMQIGAVITTIFLILVFQLPRASVDNDQAKEIAGAIQKDLKDSLATGMSEGKRLEGNFGEITPIVEILNDLRSEVAMIQKEFKAEIDQYDFENLFTPENITNSENISRLKDDLNVTISKLNGLIIKYKELQDGVATRLEQADISPSLKDSVLKGFYSKKSASDPIFNAFMKNEVAIYQKLIDILTFFEERQGEFKVIDKMPYFFSEPDSKAFNDLITSMQSLGAERDRLAQKMIEQQSESIQMLGKYTR